MAVIGAGAAGMVAAYELLRAGFTPTVFEASDRIGGRNYSLPFLDDGRPSGAFAEMGAMRVPTSNKTFYYYADAFKMQTSDFPDPGKVPTVLYYENQAYTWTPNGDPPGPFAQIASDFNAFAKKLTTPIWEAWSDHDKVVRLWQQFLDEYGYLTFLEAIAQGIPRWTPEQLNAFGALGMGSGGFGPLYGVCFLEMLRILVNQWEVNQQLMKDGINGLTDSFYSTPVTQPNGRSVSLQGLNAVRLKTPVTAIDRSGAQPAVTYTDPGTGQPVTESFPAVIVATTSRSMEMLGLTLPTATDGELLQQSQRVAIRNLSMMNSSKLFIRTRTKFWKDAGQNLPWNIQTDELPRGTYCLDYPQTDYGVVLISYTWGDDSSKLLALDPPARFALFKSILAKIHPQFASHLVPLNGDADILNIDWEATDYYYGAFKLDLPGQEPDVQAVYYQFLSALQPDADTGVYLAGDSVSWSGGWTEGALQTGLNAACAAAQHIGATLPPNSPMSQNPNMYNYAKTPGGAQRGRVTLAGAR